MSSILILEMWAMDELEYPQLLAVVCTVVA